MQKYKNFYKKIIFYKSSVCCSFEVLFLGKVPAIAFNKQDFTNQAFTTGKTSCFLSPFASGHKVYWQK